MEYRLRSYFTLLRWEEVFILESLNVQDTVRWAWNDEEKKGQEERSRSSRKKQKKKKKVKEAIEGMKEFVLEC